MQFRQIIHSKAKNVKYKPKNLEESYGNSVCAHVSNVLDFMKKEKKRET